MSGTSIAIDQLQDLTQFDTPTISNAMEALRIAPRAFTSGTLVATVPAGRAIAGLAVTATMKEQWGGKFAHIEPWLRFLDAVEESILPVIAVFHDESEAAGVDAMIGEGMSRIMRASGAIGVLCDGKIRDIDALRSMAFPVWAGGLAPDRGRIRFHKYQTPVTISGMRVEPGDLIHADENGALAVPAGRIGEILAAAAEINAKEAKLFKMVSEPTFRVARLYEFYSDALKNARQEQGEF